MELRLEQEPVITQSQQTEEMIAMEMIQTPCIVMSISVQVNWLLEPAFPKSLIPTQGY